MSDLQKPPLSEMDVLYLMHRYMEHYFEFGNATADINKHECGLSETEAAVFERLTELLHKARKIAIRRLDHCEQRFIAAENFTRSMTIDILKEMEEEAHRNMES